MIGADTEKNSRSTPTPAANSMATQVKREYSGRASSGPRRMAPLLDSATPSTNTITAVAVTT